MPRWKLENTPPPEEKKQPSTEGKKKDDKDKERKSTKSDKGQAQSEKADRDNKSKDKDKDKGIGSVVLICTLPEMHVLTPLPITYGLLTKHEVKMAGYCLSVSVYKHIKKNEANIQQT